MKILVFTHHLEIGGSQVNAIDLAAASRDQFGHEIVMFATPGPAADLVRGRGLRLIEAPRPRVHPSPSMGRALFRAVRAQRPDLVHAWDWPQALDAYYGVYLPLGTPMLCSVMSMGVLNAVPRNIPITMGTEELTHEARRQRRGIVELLEPPVDTELNNPAAVDPAPFRATFGLDNGALTITVVSRLVAWLKQEGIERAIASVEDLAQHRRIHFVIVGDGTAAARLRALAEAANARLGYDAILLVGAMVDPRPAYAAADIVIGMGGSILRGMAFAKPCVVLGEQGFSDVFEPATASKFFWQGYYGIGDGDLSPARLTEQLAGLLDDVERREKLGRFALETIEQRYAVEPLARGLDELYRRTLELHLPRSQAWLEGARLGARRLAATALPVGVRRRLKRLRDRS